MPILPSMPVSRATLDATRHAAKAALDAKVIDQGVFDRLVDGEITAGDSAKASFLMARKALFGGAPKRAAAAELAKAIETQMAEQG